MDSSTDPRQGLNFLIDDHTNVAIATTVYIIKEGKVKVNEKTVDTLGIKVSGNDELDTLLRYANYQTLIGINRNDYVHSLSAKNLTAEKYNQFVWWDCEIYQMPFVLLSNPKIGRNLLMYRYNRMK